MKPSDQAVCQEGAGSSEDGQGLPGEGREDESADGAGHDHPRFTTRNILNPKPLNPRYPKPQIS